MESIGEYLERCQYRNVAEWAIDSGYVYDQDTDEWTDEHGTVVDPTDQLLVAIEASETRGDLYRVTFTISTVVWADDDQDAENVAYEKLVAEGWPAGLLRECGALVDEWEY